MTKFEEKLAEIIRERQGHLPSVNSEEVLRNLANELLATLQEEHVSEAMEIRKELIENYIAYFDKKFPIQPTLKGKQKADFKNFLNTCSQMFSLKSWGAFPKQGILFEKFALLWATWGASHLNGIGKTIKGEQDQINFEKELENFNKHHVDDNGFFDTLCLAEYFYDKGYFNGHIHDGDKVEVVDGRRVNVSRFKRVAKPLKEFVSEELEEEIGRWYEEDASEEFEQVLWKDICKCARHFANWQKLQLMKDAMDGVVDEDYFIMIGNETWIDIDPSMQNKPAFGLKKGDKVKILILKED